MFVNMYAPPKFKFLYCIIVSRFKIFFSFVQTYLLYLLTNSRDLLTSIMWLMNPRININRCMYVCMLTLVRNRHLNIHYRLSARQQGTMFHSPFIVMF